MATTRYYYVRTLTSYSLTNITKENYPNPNNLEYLHKSDIYGDRQYTPFHYTTNLATPCNLVIYPDGGMFPSGYFFGAPNEIGMPPSPPGPGWWFDLTIPAGNYIYLPTYYTTAENDKPVYTQQYGSQDYWVIPPASHSYSTIHSNLTSTYMGEDVDGFDVCADDQMLVYYCATNIVFNCYSDDIAFHGGSISYVSGTLQLVKGDVMESITDDFTVKTSNSYDYIYGGYAQGSYSLEPSSVAITTTSLQAGKSATISVTRSSSTGSNASTYGFPITYKYQYSTNGGTSWTDIVSSTATTYNFTVPSNATSIMVRVIPSDSLGTGSAVASTNYTVQKPPSNYAGVSGTVKTVVPKVCVGGTIKTNVTVKKGVNGTVK